ncbi:MAG: response regulator [Acidobacteria bacterium]|nr:response regulator [Acidobacteriota bacterium]
MGNRSIGVKGVQDVDIRIEILVVEDSATQAEQLKHILEERGYRVTVAADGSAALASLSKRKPEMVISDIVMPEMNGYQLCRRMKSDEQFRSIPVMLLTSLSEPEDIIQGLEYGADHFVTKPYDKDHLLSRIQYILANRNLQNIESTRMGVEIIFAGRKHFITSDRLQILNLLLSAYETAVQKNRELTRLQDELKRFNEELENKVRGRTAALTTEIAERRRTGQRRDLQYAVTRVLAESTTFDEACQKILKAICEDLQWDLGIIWKVDTRTKVLRCAETYQRSKIESGEFETACRTLTFQSDVGFLGRVWAACQPAWIANVTLDPDFVGTPFLAGGKPNSVLAFPIAVQGKVLCIMEFFSREIPQPDDDLLEMFRSIGAQIGQFIERKDLEEQFRQAQKMEVVGTLAGGIAHDFNNLITAITGYSDLVLGQLKENEPFRRDIEEIKKAGERAATLTRQLLAFSRKQVMEVKELSLNDVVASTHNMLRRIIGENIDLVSRTDPSLGVVRADPGQLEQVLMNLAVNARDAMAKGGKLTVETRNVELDAGYAREHSGVQPGFFVMLAVSDTGHGIDPATLSHIFEPFFTTKERGKGTGLGLATVYGIVKQSGGHIEVYSEIRRGTTFKIYLPRLAQPAGNVAARIRREEVSVRGGSETILLVDDDEPIRTLVRRVLESNGYKVIEADNSEQAFLIAKGCTDPVHLLLTDMVMSGMDGRKLAERLRAIRPDVKVLYMSGYTDEAVVHRGMLEVGTAFIHKPFGGSTLVQKVQEVLGQEMPIPRAQLADSQTGSKVLVVDDDPAIVDMLKKFLMEKDYEVITAYNGFDALEKVSQHHPKVVLLDIYMPGKSGLAVLKEIRDCDKDIGVIMVTGVSDEAVGRQALSSGAFDYIIKPFDLNYLEEVLWWKLQTME